MDRYQVTIDLLAACERAKSDPEYKKDPVDWCAKQPELKRFAARNANPPIISDPNH